MNSFEALRIIESLAAGVHPGTGEPIASDSLLHDRNVVVALAAAAQALANEVQAEARAPTAPPRHAGAAWSSEETEQLLSAFDQGMDVKALAERHGRTSGAIRSRLAHLGKVPNQGTGAAGRPAVGVQPSRWPDGFKRVMRE